MAENTRGNFFRQQGFRDVSRHACEYCYPALMLQPRLVGILFVAGLEAFLLVAIAGLVFGRFCLGSLLFLHLRGEGAFARRTVPWA